MSSVLSRSWSRCFLVVEQQCVGERFLLSELSLLRAPHDADAAWAIQASVTSTALSSHNPTPPCLFFSQHTRDSTSMTDSPAVRIPIDPQEQPILDHLLGIRTQLELLRADKSTYVKSEDVIRLYCSVIEQVECVNNVRTHKRLEQNRGLSHLCLASPLPMCPHRISPSPLRSLWLTSPGSRHCPG